MRKVISKGLWYLADKLVWLADWLEGSELQNITDEEFTNLIKRSFPLCKVITGESLKPEDLAGVPFEDLQEELNQALFEKLPTDKLHRA